MEIRGAVLIGAEERVSGTRFTALDAATGEPLTPSFSESSVSDVDAACQLAARAFPQFSALAPEARAHFLETVAQQIRALGDDLIVRAMAETGLPRGRLETERARTTSQLELFAAVVREGAWMDVTIDHALPQRVPLPRPDLRRYNVAVGPVAVFGASNFPLAFSVAGGDTAAAFAAGCPVIVKGHPAHPGTGELVARAVRAAVAQCQIPAGVFSYLPGTTHELGVELVSDPRIKAVGFTGSRAGGLALVKAAAARQEPIPVFAEMSSINPVILFSGAARTRAAELGKAYVASLTLGAGQFCTNPGVLLALEAVNLDAFVRSAAEALRQIPPAPMLTGAIRTSFEKGVQSLTGHSGVQTVARGAAGAGASAAGAASMGADAGNGLPPAALFSTDASNFTRDPVLSQEIFGAASVIVRARDIEEIARIVSGLEGQLTATVLFDDSDADEVAHLLPLLERKVGRILANGWPTGVEVCHAMVHGGPYPATSDSRVTSVGALAIDRFLRPVCYQNLPDVLLPPALREANPYRVARRIDGVVTAPTGASGSKA